MIRKWPIKHRTSLRRFTQKTKFMSHTYIVCKTVETTLTLNVNNNGFPGTACLDKRAHVLITTEY